MIERLGQVCGWLGNTLAALLLTAAGFLALFGTAYSDDPHRWAGPVFAGIVPAIVIWLIGRILRYIFAGNTVR